GAGAGRGRRSHHLPAPAAQRAALRDRADLAAHPGGGAGGGVALVPRPRHPAADALLGRGPGGYRAHVLPRAAVAGAGARHRPLLHRAGLQPARRRDPGRLRPAAARQQGIGRAASGSVNWGGETVVTGRIRFNRRVGRRPLLLAGLGGTAALLAAACGGGSDNNKSSGTGGATQGTPAAGGTAQAEKLQRGGTLTLSVENQMGNLHPTETGGSGITRAYVYERLANYDYRNGKAEMSAAASLEQPEPTRVIFTIKPNARWQPVAPTNGRPLTSEDVVVAWNSFRDDPRATGNKGIFTQEIASLRTPDPATLVVQFKRANVWLTGPHRII